MKTAVYGGSFNPPHLGHLGAARAVLSELKPDRLLILPDNIPPHKQLASGSPKGPARADMCRLCFGGLPRTEIDERELRREGPSYTVDTLQELKRAYPEDEFDLVIGSDMLLSFTGWRRFEEILSLCRLVVLSREEGDREALKAAAAELRKKYKARVRLLRRAPLVVSSTQLREALKTGEGELLLHPAVLSYIREHDLYKN